MLAYSATYSSGKQIFTGCWKADPSQAKQAEVTI